MGSPRRDVISLLYDRPTEIAHRLGYDKLTPLHDQWMRDMVFGTEDETIQAHRGSYKTTCLHISFALMMVLYPDRRIIFLRKTDDDVAEVMAATANVLQSGYLRAICEALYGCDLRLTRATQSSVSTNLRQGVSGAPQLLGLGCGGSLTGKHADYIFTDDIINVKDRVSGAERERIKLIYQELQNIRNRGGRIFNTGTPWHKDDAFQLMPNIRRWDCRQTGLMTRDEIERVRRSMSPSLFAANYELKHIADEEAMFKAPGFFHDPTLLRDGIAQVDASYGGKDGTALTIISERDGRYHAYLRLWQAHVDDVLPEILHACDALGAGTIFCELNADKGYLRKKILRSGHPCAGYQERENKYIKISTHLRGAWDRVDFLDCDPWPLDADALNQVLDYSENAAHDDAPDSLASAIRQMGRRPGVKAWEEGV